MENLHVDALEEKLLFLLLSTDKQKYIFSNCSKDFFVDAVNRQIYSTAKGLYDQGITPDFTIVCEKNKGANFDEIMLKLVDITDCFAPSTQAKIYCELLFEQYIERCIKSVNTVSDVKRINELKEKYIFDDTASDTHISANIDRLINNYSNDSTSSIVTLYGQIDDCIGSFMGGDYIVCGAATSMGKSTFALNLARNVCMQDKSVLYFSLEMPLEQIQNKFICMQEGLNANKYRSFGFNLAEWEKFKKGARELKQWNLNVVCDYGLTPEKMHQYITQQKEKGLDFVVVDYLGLMSGYSNKTLYEKTTYLSRNMKLLASEFQVPVMCLVQLNRDSKNRQDKRPQLSDIRESGAIEQDADVVLMLHREGYYNPNISPRVLEIWVPKNRHGESNRLIKLDFDLKTQLIKEF